MKATAIFDIGKTNKKFLLFDSNYQEVHKKYIRIEEQLDEDGFPCDDIDALQAWMKQTIAEALEDQRFSISNLNFSAYGASFVHIDEEGKVIAPLYNYLKPFPSDILEQFHQTYGDSLSFAKKTASPPLGMLNSGLQLYWLKYARPEQFKKIKWSLHLPQFLSYLFTGSPISEYTSIGCHTGLWNMEQNDYHDWVYAEEIDQILPPIVRARTSINRTINGQALNIGPGIHDSSAALIPYTRLDRGTFMVLSTGTWSICLNPFNQEALSSSELKKDCLQFLDPNGKQVKASRLFLGNEYKIWIKRLAEYFHLDREKHRSVKPDFSILDQLKQMPTYMYKWQSIPSDHTKLSETNLAQFKTYEIAYHKLMQELADLQIQSILLAKGTSTVSEIYIDGGFVDNELFLHFLSQSFLDCRFHQTTKPLGSAIGAAMVMDDPKQLRSDLKKHSHHPTSDI